MEQAVGQAIAIRLAADGAKVALLGRDETRRSKELPGTLDEGLEAIRQLGGDAIAVRCDIADPAFDKGEIIRQTEAAFGASPDILVDSAAAPREFGPAGNILFEQTPREFFMRGVEAQRLEFLGSGETGYSADAPARRRLDPGDYLFAGGSSSPATLDGAPAPIDRLGGACPFMAGPRLSWTVSAPAPRALYRDNIAVNNLATTGAVATPMSLPIAKPTEAMEAFVEAAFLSDCRLRQTPRPQPQKSADARGLPSYTKN